MESFRTTYLEEGFREQNLEETKVQVQVQTGKQCPGIKGLTVLRGFCIPNATPTEDEWSLSIVKEK